MFRFVNAQVFPSWKHFGDELKIDFKPFGKADVRNTFTVIIWPRELKDSRFQKVFLKSEISQHILYFSLQKVGLAGTSLASTDLMSVLVTRYRPVYLTR